MTTRTIAKLHVEALESRVAPGAVGLDLTHTCQGDLGVVGSDHAWGGGEKATIARGCIGITANNYAAMRDVAQDSGGRYFPVN